MCGEDPVHQWITALFDLVPDRFQNTAADVLARHLRYFGGKDRFHCLYRDAEIAAELGGDQVGAYIFPVVDRGEIVVRRHGPARVLAEPADNLFKRGNKTAFAFSQFGHGEC